MVRYGTVDFLTSVYHLLPPEDVDVLMFTTLAEPLKYPILNYTPTALLFASREPTDSDRKKPAADSQDRVRFARY